MGVELLLGLLGGLALFLYGMQMMSNIEGREVIQLMNNMFKVEEL